MDGNRGYVACCNFSIHVVQCNCSIGAAQSTYLQIEQLVIIASPQHNAFGQTIQTQLELAIVDQILQRRLMRMLMLMRLGNAAAK